MDRYHPESAPDPAVWLALDEMERQLLIEQYHRDARVKMPRSARRLHAAIHTVVENQVALEDQIVVRDALARLMSEGLSRHDAVHAIGSVLAAHIHGLLSSKEVVTDSHAHYYAGLQELTAEKWRDG